MRLDNEDREFILNINELYYNKQYPSGGNSYQFFSNRILDEYEKIKIITSLEIEKNKEEFLTKNKNFQIIKEKFRIFFSFILPFIFSVLLDFFINKEKENKWFYYCIFLFIIFSIYFIFFVYFSQKSKEIILLEKKVITLKKFQEKLEIFLKWKKPINEYKLFEFWYLNENYLKIILYPKIQKIHEDVVTAINKELEKISKIKYRTFFKNFKNIVIEINSYKLIQNSVYFVIFNLFLFIFSTLLSFLIIKDISYFIFLSIIILSILLFILNIYFLYFIFKKNKKFFLKIIIYLEKNDKEKIGAINSLYRRWPLYEKWYEK